MIRSQESTETGSDFDPGSGSGSASTCARREFLEVVGQAATGLVLSGSILRGSEAQAAEPGRASLSRRPAPPPPSTPLDYMTTGTNCESGSIPNTKGKWVEILPSTTRDYVGLFVMVECDAEADFLVDLGIGPAGQETPLIADMLLSGAPTNNPHLPFYLPLFVPAGSRLSTRCQASGSLLQARIERLYGTVSDVMRPRTLSTCTTLGAHPGSSGGTVVDPGEVAETRGEWVEFTPGLSTHTRAIVLMAGDHDRESKSGGRWVIDVGIGARGEEQVVIPDWLIRSAGSDAGFRGQGVMALPVSIPPETRIVVRCASSTTRMPRRLIDVSLLAIA
jgi:hypothetical protein